MKSLFLLPLYFKKVGIILLLLVLLVYASLYFFNIDIEAKNQFYLNQFMFSLATLALFFLNFYKREIEDSTWLLKRLHALFFSIFLGINFYIINSFINIISEGGMYNLGGDILFFILLFNLVQMIGLNTKPKKENEESEQ